MTRKFKLLAAANLLLVVVLFLSIYSPNTQKKSTSQALFSLSDSSGINLFEIAQHKVARKNKNHWLLNDGVRVQAAIVKGIFTILQKIEVKNELNGEVNRRALEALKTNGIHIKAFANEQVKLDFRFTTLDGENIATLDGKKAYSIFVPGVMVDLARFFSISPATWRENTLFETSAQSLKSFSVQYPHSTENSFKMLWDSTFFRVEALTSLDSMALWDYLQYLPRVKAVQFIESKPLEDSIKKALPFAEIRLEDIRSAKPTLLKVYALPSRLVGQNQDGEIVELSFRDFNPKAKTTVLVNRKFFEAKK